GHATLASAAVVMERLEPGRTEVLFLTLASGALPVTRTAVPGRYVMDFPQRPSVEVEAPVGLAAALGLEPLEVWADEVNYVALLDGEGAVRGVAPDLAA